MRRKRRGFKKGKMSGKNSEKAGIYVPWPLSVFWSSFFSEERTCIFFPHTNWSRRLPRTLSVFCSSFFFEKRTRTPFPHVRRVEGPPAVICSLLCLFLSKKENPVFQHCACRLSLPLPGVVPTTRAGGMTDYGKAGTSKKRKKSGKGSERTE